jgi:3-deoxy-D-manno-octulosonate 8-phosphate phosphatase (KDO 8-P phosphatase)
LDVLVALLRERGVSAAQAAFVGNDVPDLECMRHVRVAIAVRDAYPEVKAVAHLLTTRPGGFGAVREVCDWLLAARQEG